MIWIPVQPSSVVRAVADRPPPIAWRNREKKSALMKRYVYVFGAKREKSCCGVVDINESG